ncbi:MAG: prephenate dehydratase [Candidatus Tyrphobacter sp.]
MRQSIGFQGTSGAFSEEAACTILRRARCRGYETFDDLLSAVNAKEVTYGMLPVENSIYGSIARSYDLIAAHRNVRIVDELSYPISQCLIGLPGSRLADIVRVASHPVALEQCHEFLKSMPRAKTFVAYDTAGAVADVARRGDPTAAAVGSALAARRYGCAVLAENIQDDAQNETRFFIIERDGHPRRDSGKGCLALTLPHARGTLQNALAVLADADCNLTALVARPDRQNPFNYVFYVEFACLGAQRQLDVLRTLGASARLLGTY